MDQLILHHGVLLTCTIIILLGIAAVTIIAAIRIHANASAGIPRDPLQGIEFRR